MLVSDGYAPLKTEHVSLHAATAPSVTELLQLPALDYGTVYHHISEMRIYHTVSASKH